MTQGKEDQPRKGLAENLREIREAATKEAAARGASNEGDPRSRAREIVLREEKIIDDLYALEDQGKMPSNINVSVSRMNDKASVTLTANPGEKGSETVFGLFKPSNFPTRRVGIGTDMEFMIQQAASDLRFLFDEKGKSKVLASRPKGGVGSFLIDDVPFMSQGMDGKMFNAVEAGLKLLEQEVTLALKS